MQIIPSFINSWFTSKDKPLPQKDDLILAHTQAKYKEVKYLIIEQSLLNDQYLPYKITHPTKLSKIINELLTYFNETPHSFFLESKYGISIRKFEYLDDKTKIDYFLHRSLNGKNLFDRIGELIQNITFPFVSSLSKDHPFYDTDLIVFKDDYKGPMPINGIYQTELNKIEKLFSDIYFNNTILKIEDSLGFRVDVLKAIRKLLTRKAGRDLIYSLVNPSYLQQFLSFVSYYPTCSSIRILPHSSKSFVSFVSSATGAITPTLYLSKNSRTELFIDLSDQNSIAQISYPHYTTEKCPFFITFAHELIHIRHWMQGKNFESKEKNELANYTNAFEKVTITGELNHQLQDSVSENAIRQEFSFFPRLTHLGVNVDYNWI